MNLWFNDFVIFLLIIFSYMYIYIYIYILISSFFACRNLRARPDDQQGNGYIKLQRKEVCMEFYSKIPSCCCFYLRAIKLLWRNSYAVPAENTSQKAIWIWRKAEEDCRCSPIRDWFLNVPIIVLEEIALHPLSKQNVLIYRDADMCLVGKAKTLRRDEQYVLWKSKTLLPSVEGNCK